MALTRVQFETILINRCGKQLTAAGLDGTTVDGANADLNDPLGYAIRQAGGSVADLSSVADADLATFAASDYDKLFDFAEYRTLENISGNLDLVDITEGPHRESLSQLAAQIEKRLTRLGQKIESKYYTLYQKTAKFAVLSEYDV